MMQGDPLKKAIAWNISAGKISGKWAPTEFSAGTGCFAFIPFETNFTLTEVSLRHNFYTTRACCWGDVFFREDERSKQRARTRDFGFDLRGLILRICVIPINHLRPDLGVHRTFWQNRTCFFEKITYTLR